MSPGALQRRNEFSRQSGNKAYRAAKARRLEGTSTPADIERARVVRENTLIRAAALKHRRESGTMTEQDVESRRKRLLRVTKSRAAKKGK
jgi:hypothetical protein